MSIEQKAVYWRRSTSDKRGEHPKPVYDVDTNVVTAFKLSDAVNLLIQKGWLITMVLPETNSDGNFERAFILCEWPKSNYGDLKFKS